jgi:hypothetical protein
MTQSNDSKDKLEDFIIKLIARGYIVEEVSKKPQIFSINGKRVNTRSRSNYKYTSGGSRSFWYSIAFRVLQEVKWVIYLTTTSDYFYMFPSSFLVSIKTRMYPDKNKDEVGVFDIDWDNELIS